MPNNFDGVQEHRYPIEDFSGGIVSDLTLKKSNELLDALNVIINPKGGFKKRKGSELLTPPYLTGETLTQLGLDSESNIWAYVFWVKGIPSFAFEKPSLGGIQARGTSAPIAYIVTGNFNTIAERDIMVFVEFDSDALLGAYYDAWIVASGTKGFHAKYTHGIITEVNLSSVDAVKTCLETEAPTIFSTKTYMDDYHTVKEITSDQLELLNYCLFGHWDKILEIIEDPEEAEPDTRIFDSTVNKLTSMIELSTRNTTTNVKSRILLATYYIDLVDMPSGYLTKGVLIRLNKNTTGLESGLKILTVTELKTNMWTFGKPDWAMYQNRAFCVNGIGDGVGTPDRIWTDGTSVYNIGVAAPTVTASNSTNIVSGGYLSDGVYTVKYSFYRSTAYGCESNLNATGFAVTLAGGGAVQSFTVRVTPSADAQVDKIKLYRTKLGDSAYYYESVVANTPDTGQTYKTVTFGVLSDNAMSTIADNLGLGNDNDRPEPSNYICCTANRAWYATANYIYYSKIDKPEQVPAINQISFDPDDGEIITNLSAFSNYVMVQKETKTWIIDANNPDMVKPIQLSNNIGCISKKTFCICGNGQEVIWLSQEGFYWSDGVKLESLCKNKIYLDLMQNVDKSIISNARAIYYPSENLYICFVPYLNSNYRIWVFNLLANHWTRFDYAVIPHSFCLWTDDYDIKRLVFGSLLPGVEYGKRSWFSHFFLADKADHYKDASATSTCTALTTVTYTNITVQVITGWDSMGSSEILKSLRSFHMDWYSHGAATGTVAIKGDYGNQSATSITLTHAGIQNEPVVADWEHGYLYLEGWDYQINETEKAPIGGFNTAQRNFSVKFTETSDSFVKVYGWVLYFKAMNYRTE